MTEASDREELYQALRSLGADLSRWEPEHASVARAALLSDPEFRRGWEAERSLDDALAALREDVAARVSRSGAVGRVRTRTLRLARADPLAGIGWPRIAAAVLLAGMLGAAMDLALLAPEEPPPDVVAFDPLAGLGEVELQ